MNEIRKVRRYWRKDLNTDWKEQTAVTKKFDEAIADISSVLCVTKAEAALKLLNKGSLESKCQIWILLDNVGNPFSLDAKKTAL